jgi:hypothetical protein
MIGIKERGHASLRTPHLKARFHILFFHLCHNLSGVKCDAMKHKLRWYMVHWYITKSYTRIDKWVSCVAGAWPH